MLHIDEFQMGLPLYKAPHLYHGPLNHKTANEDSLAFTERVNKAIANLNQLVELLEAGRDHNKDTDTIFEYILLNDDYFVSFRPCLYQIPEITKDFLFI